MSIVDYDWAGLEGKTQDAVISYRFNEWKSIVATFCSQNIVAVSNAYDQLIKNNDSGYLVLKWHIKGQCCQDVVIYYATWDSAFSHHDKQDVPEGAYIVMDESNQDKSKIPVFSSLDTFNPITIPCSVFYGNDDDSGFVTISNYPGDNAFLLIDSSIHSEVSERTEKRSKAKKEAKDLEINKEDGLYDWLRIQGINVERQVKTSSKHFIDLWIPDKLMIEVKRGTVSGNDVCQCIEYTSEYNIPILLVGEKISSAASRGLKGFNSLCPESKILYTTWDTVYSFLLGYIGD